MESWQQDRGASAFTMVEIEVNSRCNRTCSYCPNSVAPRAAPKFMSDAMFELILERLREADFGGRLSYHFYGEPLLHPRLEALVARASAVLPEMRQVLYTNGDLLTDARYEQLLEAGIDHFIITYHDGVPSPARLQATILVPQLLQLTNRGGLVEAGPQAAALPCFAPSTMLIITITGNIVLCYEDARETEVMGNLKAESLLEIWESPRFRSVRAALAAGDREQAGICRRCNNRAHLTAAMFDYVA